jgi:hypothetical protein
MHIRTSSSRYPLLYCKAGACKTLILIIIGADVVLMRCFCEQLHWYTHSVDGVSISILPTATYAKDTEL